MCPVVGTIKSDNKITRFDLAGTDNALNTCGMTLPGILLYVIRHRTVSIIFSCFKIGRSTWSKCDNGPRRILGAQTTTILKKEDLNQEYYQ